MMWKPYLDDKLIAEHPLGFSIIKPRDAMLDSQPIFCPYCERIMSSTYDEDAYKKFECCEECANAYVYVDRERWNSGWRPSREKVL